MRQRPRTEASPVHSLLMSEAELTFIDATHRREGEGGRGVGITFDYVPFTLPSPSAPDFCNQSTGSLISVDRRFLCQACYRQRSITDRADRSFAFACVPCGAALKRCPQDSGGRPHIRDRAIVHKKVPVIIFTPCFPIEGAKNVDRKCVKRRAA